MRTGRIVYAAVALAIFAGEVFIAVRLPHLNWVRGSLGDILVVPLLYASVLAIRDVDRRRLAAGTFLFACCIELTQVFHLSRRLNLSPSGALGITLGSTASWEDVFYYLVGALLALGSDVVVRRALGRRFSRRRSARQLPS